MDKTKNPNIRCEGVFLSQIAVNIDTLKLFTLHKDADLDFKVSFRFAYEIAEDSERHRLRNRLLVTALNDDVGNIRMAVDGYFYGTDVDYMNVFAANSGAILMPYIRSWISTFTSWMPMGPIVLPIYNMTGKALEKRNELVDFEQLKLDFESKVLDVEKKDNEREI